MSAASHFRFAYLAFFSKPTSERFLFRLIRRHKIRRILELGMGDGSRAGRLADVALRYHPPGDITYAALDLFESRAAGDGPGQSLRTAYKQLRRRGIRVRLVPGEFPEALQRAANNLRGMQLVLVSAAAYKALRNVWFYLPRALAADCRIFVEQLDGGVQLLKPLSHEELQQLAVRRMRRRAA